MIGRLSGILLEKNPPHLLLDFHGVGYEIDAPMSTFYQMPAFGEPLMLLTHPFVRADAPRGFIRIEHGRSEARGECAKCRDAGGHSRHRQKNRRAPAA